jgi:perosamine synthetase
MFDDKLLDANMLTSKATEIADTPAAMAPFICQGDESLWRGIERSLDNGLGEVLLADAAGRYVGRVDLHAIRDAIRSGAYLINPSLLSAATTNEVVPRFVEPVLDATGRIEAVIIDRAATFLPVSEPDLSHREFRNFTDAFLSTWISSTGDYVRTLEKRFSAMVGTREGVAVTNGTDALQLALLALGVGPGDEVIVPDLTFVATANAVLHVGARPVIVDIDLDTWCISANTIAAAITPRTRAVIPVHLFGRPAPMTEIATLCKAKGLFVIEDCAEAHGATYDGRQVGSFSDVSTFSFFANKIITTGEGGMCLTNDPDVAARMRLLRDHGMRPERRYWHEVIAYNFRMTNPQAAIGCAQLDRLPELLAKRRSVHDLYVKHLAAIPGVSFAPQLSDRFQPVIWFACALVPPRLRAKLIDACKAENIDLRPFNHTMSILPPLKEFGSDCPVSTALSAQGVLLPTSGRIDDGVAAKIAGVFRQVLVSDVRRDDETKDRMPSLAVN